MRERERENIINKNKRQKGKTKKKKEKQPEELRKKFLVFFLSSIPTPSTNSAVPWAELIKEEDETHSERNDKTNYIDVKQMQGNGRGTTRVNAWLTQKGRDFRDGQSVIRI